MKAWGGRATVLILLGLVGAPFGCSLDEVDVNHAGTGGATTVVMDAAPPGRDASVTPSSGDADASDAASPGKDAPAEAAPALDAREADLLPDVPGPGVDGAREEVDAADGPVHSALCESGHDCVSGHCVDGVCCDTACDGVCQSCNQVGKAGHCLPLAANTPDSECRPMGGCGRTGLCDGAGQCATAVVGTVCQTASCSDGVARQIGTCDSQGACVAGPVVACGSLGCNASGTRCNAGCPSGDLICAVGSYCAGDETCLPKKKNGEACASAHECLTGTCLDGMCCEQACDGPCLSCALPGMEGRCLPVPAGQPEPKARCVAALPSTCGRDGLCDGHGSCQLYPQGTECRASSCAADTFVEPSTCDGEGACVGGPSITCAPYHCDPSGAGCLSVCQSSDDCVTGTRCSHHACVRRNLQPDCASDAECESNHCAGGVCCDTSCQDPCHSCVLVGHVGTCSPLPADQRPDGAACP